MPLSTRDAVFAASAAALGAWAMYMTQTASKETLDPFVAACTPGGNVPPGLKLVAHEPRLGLGLGTFVCIITQFLNLLTESPPAGWITWLLTILCAVSAGVLVTSESGRSGARGAIRYPTPFYLLCQLIGVSVAFPLLWVPSCIFFGSKDGFVLPLRMYAGILLNLPALLLTYWVFNLDTASYPWQVCAGILGGPVIPLFNLVMWRMYPRASDKATPKAVAEGASATAVAHLIAFAVGLAGWAIVVWSAYQAYGLDLSAVWGGVWANADGAVRFMTIDAGVLFLGVVVYMAWRNTPDAVAALLLTPVLGPAAACSLILWRRERLSVAPPSSAATAAQVRKQA